VTLPSPERIREIAHRWIEHGWRDGNLDVVDELHSADFVDHDSAGRPPDNSGFKAGIARLYAGFPDFRAEISDLVIDATRGTAAIRWTATGTHRGNYLGAEPSDRVITFKGIEIIRIRDDRIVERWGEWDGLDLLDQLGREPV
jgi:steroid delta-isomerase-like uncharacterized protein